MSKKSERLEVRLSHADKESFQSVCESSGETPSDVIRRFIRRYIRRADSDRVGDGMAALRAMAMRNRGKFAVAGMALAFGAFVSSLGFSSGHNSTSTERVEALQPMDAGAAFARFDVDGDGVLSFSEFNHEKGVLFKVMDFDGSGSLLPGEFKSIGRMALIEVSLETLPAPIIDPEREECLAEITPEQDLQIITFDLRYPDMRVMAEIKPQVDFTRNYRGLDRLIVWDKNSRKPCFVWLVNEENIIR
ncbi:MAG: hypothetical protein AAF296_04380, partial [Pseudomonadota bacterium]